MTEGSKKIVYYLDIKLPTLDNNRVKVLDVINCGSDENRNDIQFNYEGIHPLHCSFRVHNEILSVSSFDDSGQTTLGDLPLAKGKMYIIDKGDSIHLPNEIKIIIRRETEGEDLAEEEDIHEEDIDQHHTSGGLTLSGNTDGNFAPESYEDEDEDELSDIRTDTGMDLDLDEEIGLSLDEEENEEGQQEEFEEEIQVEDELEDEILAAKERAQTKTHLRIQKEIQKQPSEAAEVKLNTNYPKVKGSTSVTKVAKAPPPSQSDPAPEEEYEYVDDDSEIIHQKNAKKPGFFSKLFKKKGSKTKDKEVEDKLIAAAKAEEARLKEEREKVKSKPPQKKSFLKKLFTKNKKIKASANIKLNVKKSSDPLRRTPGIILRSFTLFIDLCVLYVIYHSFIADEGYFKQLQDVSKSLTSLGQELLVKTPIEYSKWLAPIINGITKNSILIPLIYLITYLLITNFLLGKSVGQILLGYADHSGFIGKRIKAVFRVIISIFTIPTVILESPAFFGKRSFKEVITFSNIYIKRKWVTAASIIVLVPLIFISSIFHPLVTYPELIKSPQIKEVREKRRKFDNKKRDFYFKEFGIKVPRSFFKDKNYFTFPIFSYKKNKLESFPSLVNKKTLKINTPYSKEFIPASEFISKESLTFEPLFLTKYKGFSSRLRNNHNNSGHPGEFTDLVLAASKLSKEKILDLVLQDGPFLLPHLKVKQALYNLYKDTGNYELINYIGNVYYFFIGKNKNTKEIELLIPVRNGFNKVSFKNLNNLSSEDFASQVQFIKVIKELLNEPTYTAFEITSILTKIGTLNLTKDRMDKFQRYYQNLSKKLKRLRNKDLIEIYNESLEDMLKYLKSKESSPKNGKKIARLRRNLKNYKVKVYGKRFRRK